MDSPLTLLSSSLSLSLLPLSLSSPARWSPYWGMHSSRASATSQWIGDLEMMTSLALLPSRLRRRRPSLVTASQSRLLTQQVLDGKPQPRFCDHTFVFFSCQHIFFSEVPAIYDGTRLLVYRLLPKSIPDRGLKVNFEFPFVSLSNAMWWYGLTFFYWRWGFLQLLLLGISRQRWLFTKKTSSTASHFIRFPTILSPSSWHVYWESHKWIIGQKPNEKNSVELFLKRKHVI